MGLTAIEWATYVWNFIVGCTRVSAGCCACYAERMAWRHVLMCRARGIVCKYEGTVHLVGGEPRWTGRINFDRATITLPLHTKKPGSWFVASMSDPFHDKVLDAWLDYAVVVMAQSPEHTFKLLTKRPERMRDYSRGLLSLSPKDRTRRLVRSMYDGHPAAYLVNQPVPDDHVGDLTWPLPNLELGVSVENRAQLRRLDLLRETPAARRIVSFEPLLEDLGDDYDLAGIHQAIFGGESGGSRCSPPRPCDVAWIRRGMRQCDKYGVAKFVKQLGAFPVYSEEPGEPLGPGIDADDPIVVMPGGRMLHRLKLRDKKGGDMAEWPGDLRVREFPQ